MRRFIFHFTADTVPPASVDWECVLFSSGMVAVSLIGKILEFHSFDALKSRFEGAGSISIEWIDEVKE